MQELFSQCARFGRLAYLVNPRQVVHHFDSYIALYLDGEFVVLVVELELGVVNTPADMGREEVDAHVRGLEQTAKYVGDGHIVKVIVVPGKIVNIVVK